LTRAAIFEVPAQGWLVWIRDSLYSAWRTARGSSEEKVWRNSSGSRHRLAARLIWRQRGQWQVERIAPGTVL
jgi:hypothetical protein